MKGWSDNCNFLYEWEAIYQLVLINFWCIQHLKWPCGGQEGVGRWVEYEPIYRPLILATIKLETYAKFWLYISLQTNVRRVPVIVHYPSLTMRRSHMLHMIAIQHVSLSDSSHNALFTPKTSMSGECDKVHQPHSFVCVHYVPPWQMAWYIRILALWYTTFQISILKPLNLRNNFLLSVQDYNIAFSC